MRNKLQKWLLEHEFKVVRHDLTLEKFIRIEWVCIPYLLVFVVKP